MSGDAEAQVLERCRRGDPAAWDDLFDTHYAATGRFVFQISPALAREDVEEICQETFLAVIKNVREFHGGSRVQTWIFRIAANKTRDYVERRDAAKRGGGAAALSLQAEHPETGQTLDPPSAWPGPDEVLLDAERAAQVSQAVQRLEEPCREIIELRYFAELSYEEISAALRLNPKTVSSRLSKCLDRLEAIAREIFGGKKAASFSV